MKEMTACFIPEKKWRDFVHPWEHMTAPTNRLDCKGLYFMLNEKNKGFSPLMIMWHWNNGGRHCCELVWNEAEFIGLCILLCVEESPKI